MNVIAADPQGGIVAINVFTVRAESQRALVDGILRAAAKADIPGLLSMKLLCSTDGTRVINHMQWASERAWKDAAATHPAIAGARQRVQELVDGGGPDQYEIVDVKP